jgi:hypothetical protein
MAIEGDRAAVERLVRLFPCPTRPPRSPEPEAEVSASTADPDSRFALGKVGERQQRELETKRGAPCLGMS